MIIRILVKAHSGKNELIKRSDSDYLVFLKEEAENNKANLALLKLLRRHFKQHIKIIKGHMSKNKIIEVL